MKNRKAGLLNTVSVIVMGAGFTTSIYKGVQLWEENRILAGGTIAVGMIGTLLVYLILSSIADCLKNTSQLLEQMEGISSMEEHLINTLAQEIKKINVSKVSTTSVPERIPAPVQDPTTTKTLNIPFEITADWKRCFINIISHEKLFKTASDIVNVIERIPNFMFNPEHSEFNAEIKKCLNMDRAYNTNGKDDLINCMKKYLISK